SFRPPAAASRSCPTKRSIPSASPRTPTAGSTLEENHKSRRRATTGGGISSHPAGRRWLLVSLNQKIRGGGEERSKLRTADDVFGRTVPNRRQREVLALARVQQPVLAQHARFGTGLV